MCSCTMFLLQHQTFSSLSHFQLVTAAGVALSYFNLAYMIDVYICLRQAPVKQTNQTNS